MDIAVHVIEELSKYYPVYFSYGNHEKQYEEKYSVDIKEVFEEAGCTVLEQDYIDIEIKNIPVRIGGIYGYCLPQDIKSDRDERFIEQMYVHSFENTDRYKILLCHMPVSWISYGSLDSWNIDLVLSGHVHGGQIIFPGLGGLYAPDMGFFPGKLNGVFDSEDGSKHAVVSRGLGSTEWVPRFNNLPEIVVLDIE